MYIISQTILGELFTKNNNGYCLRSKPDFVIPQIRTVLKDILVQLSRTFSKKKLEDGNLKAVHVEFVEITSIA